MRLFRISFNFIVAIALLVWVLQPSSHTPSIVGSGIGYLAGVFTAELIGAIRDEVIQ